MAMFKFHLVDDMDVFLSRNLVVINPSFLC